MSSLNSSNIYLETLETQDEQQELNQYESQKNDISDLSKKGYQCLKENRTSEAIDLFKQILIIDEIPLFREYLRLKLEENNIQVSVGISTMDGVSKMKIIVPDLIIMDYHLSHPGFLELLRQKKANPNTAQIPVIILANHIEQKQILELVPYNVKKVFAKPIKIDTLFAALSLILGIPFLIDETPSFMDVHVNDSIIFIEIA